MKTTRKYGLTAVAALVLALSVGFYATAQNNNNTITTAQLPAAAQTFIKTHFNDVTVASTQIDKDVFETEYNVYLSNGTEIEFDSKGQWKEIDGHNTALPVSVVPAAINSYLTTNYKGQQVTQLDKSRNGYDVELANGLELDFNNAGKFIKIDD
jgi:hypothetical protein